MANVEKNQVAAQKSSKEMLKKFRPFIMFLGLFVLLFLLIDVVQLGNDSGKFIFLDGSNIINVLNQITMNAIIAIGMTLVIMVEGIDLSVGSIVAAGGVLLSILYADLQLAVPVGIIIVMIAGLGIGFINGIIISKLRLPAFVVTMATMLIFRGFAMLMVNGQAKFIPGSEFKQIGNENAFGFLPWSVVVMILAFVVFHLLLNNTKFGRQIYVIGGNEETALLSGIKVVPLKTWTYMISSMAAALSGCLLASRLGSGSPNVGTNYELDAIAAAILGGTSLSGGVGTMIGTIAGALIIGILNNAMNLLGLSSYWQYVAKGLVILVVVVLDRKSHVKK